MLSESYTAVSTNRRKNFDGKKWLRVVGMLLVLLIIAFPFLWLIISSFKYEKDIISFPREFLQMNIPLRIISRFGRLFRC